MKFTSSLLTVALTLPLVYGHPPSYSSYSTRRGRHLRDEQQTAEKAKRSKSSKGHPCNNDNDKTNPLPRLETGCPCYNLNTVVTHMNDVVEDAGVSQCEFHDGNAGYMVDSDHKRRWLSLHASEELTLRSEPAIHQFSSLEFSVLREEEPGWEQMSCYASVYASELREAPNSDDRGVGEGHEYFIDLELTADEYSECIDVMWDYYSQLPASCVSTTSD